MSFLAASQLLLMIGSVMAQVSPSTTTVATSEALATVDSPTATTVWSDSHTNGSLVPYGSIGLKTDATPLHITAVPVDSEVHGLVPTVTMGPISRLHEHVDLITAIPEKSASNISGGHRFGLTGIYVVQPPTTLTYRHRGLWTKEYLMTYSFHRNETSSPLTTMLPLEVPQNWDDWVERMTFDNSNRTAKSPDETLRSIWAFHIPGSTTDGVCNRSTTNSLTIRAPHTAPEIWATEMTFHKMSQGYACGGHPPYPAKISRCMAVYTTPYTLIKSKLTPYTTVRTTWIVVGDQTSSVVKTVTLTSTSTWPTTISRVHWGERWPELEDSTATHSKQYQKPCRDEISCYHHCEHVGNAIQKTLIILGAILGGLLLILAPIIYLWNQPHHIRRLRDRARRRRLEKSDRLAVGPEKRGVTAGEVVARRDGNPSQVERDGNLGLGLGTSEGRTAPRRMSTEYDRHRREESRGGSFSRFWARLLGRAD